MPFWTGIQKTSVSLKDSDILIQEINTLIEKDAIEPVRQQDAATEPVLSVESSLFRTNFCSESLYKNGFCSSGFSENSKCETSSLSGRLVSSQSKQGSIISRSKEMSPSPNFTRFSYQQRKIKSSTHSKIDISRRAVSFGQGNGLPNSGKNRQTEYGDINSFIRECSVSISLPTITRHNGILHIVNSECTLVHETYSTASPLILETKLSGFFHKDPSYTTSEITSQMVEKFSKHAERPIFSTGSDFCHHNDRCFKSGSSHQDTSNSRIVMSTENSDLSSQSTSFQADCMASINKRFTTEGFSKGVRELLSASWRKGTQKDYCSKFKKFNSWCSTRKIDPDKISLSQIADFLSYLFDSGLQYRTIAGYRSTLSTVLPPIDNFQIGQHPK
ncbi:unnamed protein product [Mytilus coruscus]|uniref:Core-binding (CB) domain-containing protein n=1 Tax=Mytilus coruscus TaxID=42192 RepID=A0A6J8B6Y1_MYTCO|nr:unnamed protein product [Mytilus coruscus]